jgi:hypothetical protein
MFARRQEKPCCRGPCWHTQKIDQLLWRLRPLSCRTENRGQSFIVIEESCTLLAVASSPMYCNYFRGSSSIVGCPFSLSLDICGSPVWLYLTVPFGRTRLKHRIFSFVISWSRKLVYPFNDDATVYRHAFSPIFNIAWIFSDRRQIFIDYRTAYALHCKKKIRKFSKLFLFWKF